MKTTALIFMALALPFLLSAMTLEKRREENRRIQDIIQKTTETNTKPSFRDSPRAARTATNRYKNQLAPRLPKTIYRQVLPTGRYSRFAGGIPR